MQRHIRGKSVFRAVLHAPRASVERLHIDGLAAGVSLHILQYAYEIKQALTPDENVQE